MREIKFKVRDKKTKRFIQDDVDIENRKNHNLGENALSPDGVLYFFESTEGGMNVIEKKNVEILFYTGLKDKNGKEIYEGDIVEYSSTNFRGLVEYQTSPETRFYLRGNEVNKDLHYVSDIEIIGNIYENPELLNNQP